MQRYYAPIEPSSLSKQEHEILDNFVAVDYYEVNHYLRQKVRGNKRLEKIINTILDIFDRVPESTQGLTTYRGQKTCPQLKKGDEFLFEAFTSVSGLKSHAKTFTKPGGCLFVFNIPKGTRGLNLLHYSGPGEQELLLPLNSKFVVVSTFSEDDLRVVRARLVSFEMPSRT